MLALSKAWKIIKVGETICISSALLFESTSSSSFQFSVPFSLFGSRELNSTFEAKEIQKACHSMPLRSDNGTFLCLRREAIKKPKLDESQKTPLSRRQGPRLILDWVIISANLYRSSAMNTSAFINGASAAQLSFVPKKREKRATQPRPIVARIWLDRNANSLWNQSLFDHKLRSHCLAKDHNCIKLY